FIRHFGSQHIDYRGIPDEGATLDFNGVKLEAVPAHFLHSSGNIQLYDPEARILMSGDVGMAIEPGQESAPLFVDDFDAHIRHMHKLHTRWMPSNRAKREWIARARDMDIEVMAPQHGRLFRGEDVLRFLDWFDALDVEAAG
ncbi:MAG TPA: MBL fold metallo-hydrolase, partial [Gammaproteobacteria bacterium]|nr:MBL fold metallo-hydrolase [Gammaproteobacteria bacterium]